jgi:hypothetical protein
MHTARMESLACVLRLSRFLREPVKAAASANPYDVVGTADAREECVQGVASGDLESLGAEHPEPLPVMDDLVGPDAAPEHLDGDLVRTPGRGCDPRQAEDGSFTGVAYAQRAQGDSRVNRKTRRRLAVSVAVRGCRTHRLHWYGPLHYLPKAPGANAARMMLIGGPFSIIMRSLAPCGASLTSIEPLAVSRVSPAPSSPGSTSGRARNACSPIRCLSCYGRSPSTLESRRSRPRTRSRTRPAERARGHAGTTRDARPG